MKATRKQDFKIAALAWLTIATMFGFMGIMYWAGIDWEKWFSFTAWTVFVFGILVVGFLDDLKKARCFVVFVILVVVYVTTWLFVLSSGIRVRDLHYMILSPFEAGVGAFILIALGGARGKKDHRAHPDVKLPSNPKDRS